MEHKNNNPNDQETGRKYLNLMFIF